MLKTLGAKTYDTPPVYDSYGIW